MEPDQYTGICRYSGSIYVKNAGAKRRLRAFFVNVLVSVHKEACSAPRSVNFTAARLRKIKSLQHDVSRRQPELLKKTLVWFLKASGLYERL